MNGAHLDDELVQRLLARELSPSAELEVRQHLTSCGSCREALAAAEEEAHEVNTLLQRVDHPPPRVAVFEVLTRARVRDKGLVRWAAGVLLVVGLAGVAYATPGSPVPGWIKAIVGRIRGLPSGQPTAPTPAPSQASDSGAAGVAVVPGSTFLILFTASHPGAEARVALSDSAVVLVRAPRDAATFTTGGDQLTIEVRQMSSPVSFEIQIPRNAPLVEIRVGGTRVFLKEGSRVVASQPPDSEGYYRLPLVARP